MQLLSLALDGHYLEPGADGRLRPGPIQPGTAQRFLVRNLTRPDADNLGVGDVLEIHTAADGRALRLADSLEALITATRRTTDIVADEYAPRLEETAAIEMPAPPPGNWYGAYFGPIAAWAPPGVPQAQWRWLDLHRQAPSEQLVVVRGVRGADDAAEVQLGLIAPVVLTAKAGEPPPDPEVVRGMRVVRDAGGDAHLEPLPPAPPPPDGLRLEEPTERLDPIFALAVTYGRLAATLGGTPAWLRVTSLPLLVRLEAAGGRLVARLADGRIATTDAALDDVCDLAMVRPDRPQDRRFYHGDAIELRAYDGHHLSVSRAVPGPESPVTGIEAGDTVPIRLALERVAGAGELVDGDRIRLVDPRNRRRGLTARAAAPHELVVGPLDRTRSVFVVHTTKNLYLTWNAAHQDHASVGIERLVHRAGYTTMRPQARVQIGPRPGTRPLRAWFDARTGDTSTTATAQGDVARLNARLPCLGVQGHVWTAPHPGAVPLIQYWSDARQDNFLAAGGADDLDAGVHGYRYAWIEGFAEPAPAPPPAGFLRTPSVSVDRAALTGRGRGAPRFTAGMAPGVARPAAPRAPRRALVLSGGAAKGCFEAGAARWLWANGFRDELDLICGISVGAINGAKLAENGAWDADQLCDLWRGFATLGRIIRTDHYTRVLDLLVRAAGNETFSMGAIALTGYLGASTALGPLAGLWGGLFAAGAGVSIAQIDRKAARILAALRVIIHSTNSLEPLRQVIHAQLQPDSMRASPIAFRAGITCMNTGQFFTVSGPRPEWTEALQAHGLIEVEPDDALAQTWLGRPLYGTNGYVMPLEQAIYASSTQPAFMEPLQVDLRDARAVQDDAAEPGGARYTELSLTLPVGMRELLDVTGQADPVTMGEHYLPTDLQPVERAIDAVLDRLPSLTRERLIHEARLDRDGPWRGANSWTQRFFDGGLRDVMAVRTALRLGARDLVVITGDRLRNAAWTYARPARPARGFIAGGLDFLLQGGVGDKADKMNAAAFQHVLATISLFVNEVARTDLLLGVAYGEAMGLVTEAARRLPREEQRRLLRDLARYRGDRAQYLFEALGVATPLGGADRDAYGIPGAEGCKITLIGPDREIIAPMDFDNAAAIDDGIELGYRAAQQPMVLTDHLGGRGTP